MAFADSTCTPIYGGGDSCPTTQFTITKTVMNPDTKQFVPNLGSTDPLYHTGDSIPFQVTITNNTNQPLSNLIIKDTLPSSIGFISGPGIYDKGTNVITITVPTLQSNTSQIYAVKTTVLANPSEEKGVICENNTVTAMLSSNTLASSSQFCIEHTLTTQVTNPTTTKKNPKTGAETTALLTLITLGSIGFYLRRKQLV